MRGSGITTSSLILKALVCLLMAAVRLRSSQNFLRASGLMAMKPSPAREFAIHHLGGGARHGVGIVADDVAEEHHLGQATSLGFGRVAHRFQVAVVQVLQPGQHDGGGALAIGSFAAAPLLGEHEVLDLHDAGHGIARVAEELQAHGAGVFGHLVHHPAGAGDQAVTAFLLDAGQAGEELVGDVLAQALLAEGGAGDRQLFGAHQRLAVGLEGLQLEAGDLGIVDLAQVVIQARDFQPLGLWRHHAPGHQVVQRRAPQHCFLAAGVHRDVAADARGLG